MRGAISHPGVFSRRRLLGVSRRGIAVMVLASLLAYLITCVTAAVWLPAPVPDVAGASAHHGHPQDAPEQVDCCTSMQDASLSARQKCILPSLFGIAVPFSLMGCFSPPSAFRLSHARPPTDPPWIHSRLHLDSTLRPRAPPR